MKLLITIITCCFIMSGCGETDKVITDVSKDFKVKNDALPVSVSNVPVDEPVKAPIAASSVVNTTTTDEDKKIKTDVLDKINKAKLPGQAKQYLPVLIYELDRGWHDSDTITRERLAGIPNQESNWKVNAHLRTDREHGCGLGQATIAYNKDGSVRFDTIAELKKLDSSLSTWDWKDCTNAQFQLRGMVLKTHSDSRQCYAIMLDSKEAIACTAAKYNGGAGSIIKRTRLCNSDPNCNPRVWFDNLETKCAQSRVKAAGYGESFCEINSKYPSRVFEKSKPFIGLMN